MFFEIIACVGAVMFGSFGQADRVLSPSVRLCSRHDAKLSECWRSSFEALRPRLAAGIPELKIVPVDPLFIPRYHLTREQAHIVAYNATLENVNVTGLTNFEILDNSIDLDNLVLKFTIRFPQLKTYSDLNLKGFVIGFNVNGRSKLTVKFTNSVFRFLFNGERYYRNGKAHIRWTETGDEPVTFDAVHFDVSNANLGNAVNANTDILYPDIYPVIKNPVNAFIIETINQVHKLYSLDTLYPRSPV